MTCFPLIPGFEAAGVIEQSFPLKQAANAWRALKAEGRARVVLDVDAD